MNLPHLQSAIQLLDQGQSAVAADVCRQALLDAPRDPSWNTLLAMSLQHAGDTAGAAAIYRQLAELQPHESAHWANLGLTLRTLGEHASAEQAYQQALALAPQTYHYLVDYGLVLLEKGDIAHARHRFLDAVDLDPSQAEARIYASIACFECGDAQRAATLLPPPAVWPQLPDNLREELATALIQVGRTDEAETLLSQPRPGQNPSLSNVIRLAQLYERTNRVEQAETLLAQAASMAQQHDRQTRIDLLQLETSLALRRKDYTVARTAAENLLALQPHIQVQAIAYFALAGIEDKQGHPAAAMAMLEKAHAIHFKLAADSVPEIAYSNEEPLQVSSLWLDDAQARYAGARSDAPGSDASPVFIVGFPRSGTTMLEQMLDAHPGYASMDERATLQRCIEWMEAQGKRYPYDLGALDDAQVEAMRQLYWSEIAKVIALAPGQQLVDKNPLNMLRLPMIVRLFPNAKIILALRHPCDVLLSCYMQNFRSPAFMVLCSSLERLAKSYVNAMRFWIHHQALLQPDLLILKYEETVDDFPAQVQRIGGFLGIAQPEFLEGFSQHAARKGYISTPSYSQVVEPVNRRAVDRWHAYAPWLAGALPILQPVATHWGYDLETAAP
ncbi:tetratricopeptide repeat-containing sulfotransferase family protein [Xanthomonas bonasiae]|uniref:tetratricopeptide repeat-containing sulfotransferase family protein n=1 Tax=Xanthomonas bonasiae TaxID=2810351 RepID=UPI0019821A3C|nr:tetratricopeptide repeat-containing sulfotransferase family protein [Xanthomonas bonasiae]MBN6111587.1 sulfotransferase [Xanthomonas bonasiae]